MHFLNEQSRLTGTFFLMAIAILGCLSNILPFLLVSFTVVPEGKALNYLKPEDPNSSAKPWVSGSQIHT